MVDRELNSDPDGEQEADRVVRRFAIIYLSALRGQPLSTYYIVPTQ